MNRNRFLAMLCATALLLMSLAAPVTAFASEVEEQPAAVDEPAPAPAPEPAPDPAPAPAPEPEPAPAPEPEPAPVTEPEPAPAPVTEPEPVPAPVTEPEPAPAEAQQPAEEPAPAEAQQPAEEPAPAEEAADAPTEEPTAEPTEEPTAEPTEEPTAEPTEEPTVEPTEEPTPEPTEEPTVEPTLEPTPVPPVSLENLAASRTEAALGEAVHFSYATENAVEVTWSVKRSDGLAADGGSAGTDGFDWQPAFSGIYTMKVTAVGADLETKEQEVQLIVRAGRLAATAVAPTGYAKLGEKDLIYDLTVSGGVEPWDVTITIEYKGDKIFTTKDFLPKVGWPPAGPGEHLLKLRVVDATGASVEAQAIVLASDNAMDPPPELPQLTRDMTFSEKLVAVAKSQLGYHESLTNFIIRDDKSIQGWSFYGKWAGMPYEEWCAMFVSWCLNAAGIPEWMMPRSANCNRWKNYLGHRYIDNEDEYIPEAGDLIFFHHDRVSKDPNFPNHIGIVVDYDPEKELVYTVEGNAGAAVSSRIYGRQDSVIVGYASMGYCMRRWDNVYKLRVREQMADNRAQDLIETRAKESDKLTSEDALH